VDLLGKEPDGGRVRAPAWRSDQDARGGDVMAATVAGLSRSTPATRPCGPGRAAVRNVTLARHIVTGAFVLVSERGWIVQPPKEVQDARTTRAGNGHPAHR
jgi:hypothetical protein